MPVTCRVIMPTNFPAIDAGIYGPAMPFKTGPLLFDLGQPGLITNILALVQWSGTTYFTNVILGCVTNLSLTPQQFNDLNAGLLYVNVTSPAYPGGEIRGQFSNQPIVSPPAFQNGNGAVLNVTGEPLENYQVQVSTDLLNWTTFANVDPTNTVFQVIDTEAANTNGSQRFYRVVIPSTGIGFF
jgi:CHRD domain